MLTNAADITLTEFLILVIERYRELITHLKDLPITCLAVDIPWVKDAYPPYANSDDASWRKAGYQTCHPLEGQFKNTNPRKLFSPRRLKRPRDSHVLDVHTPEDRMDISPEFSFDHMLQ